MSYLFSFVLLAVALVWHLTRGLLQAILVVALLTGYCLVVHGISALAAREITSQSGIIDSKLYAPDPRAKKIISQYRECKFGDIKRSECKVSTPVVRWNAAHNEELEKVKQKWGIENCYVLPGSSMEPLLDSIGAIPKAISCAFHSAIQSPALRELERMFGHDVGLQVEAKLMSDDKQRISSHDVQLDQGLSMNLPGLVSDGDTLEIQCQFNPAETQRSTEMLGVRSGYKKYDCFWFVDGATKSNVKTWGTKSLNAGIYIDGVVSGGEQFWQK